MKNIFRLIGILAILGATSFYIWKSDNKETSTLEKVEKITTASILNKEIKPIFHEVKTLARLEFFKIDAMINKKFLLLYFHTNSCYYCEKMKNITFADSRVQKELKTNYIVVSVNYSKFKQSFKKQFPLGGTPAIFFFDKEGKQITDENFYGYQSAEDFYNKIERLAKVEKPTK
ncbi:MAG: Cytochrome c-type biogenesis protein DsbD, protein-disulfide reductase [uncultured Sulfurovum sp.]|uniref:Cytochrome c-type biogenesis protein DsbD, protein-disulfide reductase n=1 Tax=uncultured Sulfurovum sp. TaxID=269237 RepID=A0A6S6TK27_9BACT|nr:MAG: Cytochrome c-type biogenesis protein DsbD, protein-disulfide reductase [uncultured Sulfurovum sp.]